MAKSAWLRSNGQREQERETERDREGNREHLSMEISESISLENICAADEDRDKLSCLHSWSDLLNIFWINNEIGFPRINMLAESNVRRE